MDILVNSHTSFGNDGNHLNLAINDGANGAVADSVANALHAAADHLPVFADFVVGIVNSVATPGLASTFRLRQNYPNPFNPATSIRYELTKSSSVVLQVFDLLGREVRLLVNEAKPAGLHGVKWDGLNDAGLSVSSGLYLYRIVSQNQVVIRKMVLMR